MLRFLISLTDSAYDQELGDDLVSECMIPAVKKMIASFKDTPNPYKGILEALLPILQDGAAPQKFNQKNPYEAFIELNYSGGAPPDYEQNTRSPIQAQTVCGTCAAGNSSVPIQMK